MINRFFVELFETSDKNVLVESCQEKFGFILPGIQLDKRSKKFEEKYMNTYDMHIPGDICTVWPMLANGACIYYPTIR